MAGFTAAVRASEQGAKVLLIDKSHGELGDGNVLMASGSLRAGGKSPKTAAKELYDFVMSEGVGFPDLVKAWSETCGRAIDWLQTVGVEIEESAPGRIWLNQKSEISYGPVYKKDVGGRALTSLKKQFVNLGGSYLNGIEGVRLIVENGRVTGLIAKQNGAEIELRAGATILTTGGFSANTELVKKYIGAHADQLQAARFQTGHRRRPAHGACRRRQDGQSAIFLRPLDRAQSAHRRSLLALSEIGLFCRRRRCWSIETAIASSTKGAAMSPSPTSWRAPTISPARR